MIEVDEALKFAPERKAPPRELPALSEREQTQLDYLDAMVDSGIARTFNGDPWVFEVPASACEPYVIEALKRRYEEGGWQVTIMPVGDEVMINKFHVIFATGTKLPDDAKKQRVSTGLPSVVSTDRVEKPTYRTRLLVRMPTRGRARQALEMLQMYRDMAGCKILMEVVVDEDDDSMLNAEVMQRLAALGVTITVGQHKSKIEACNGGKVTDWDILVLASDDMMPVAEGWALRMISEMEKHFPFFDGAIFFNDGFQKGNLCTLSIMGKRLYQMFGYVYHPDYKSLFCDREYTDVLKDMGRLVYVDEKLVEHRHHAWGRALKDAIYERNDALEGVDKETFERRKEHNFDRPEVLVSLLICTLPQRRHRLKWLVEHLYAQIPQEQSLQIEILYDDRVEPKVGEKRQALLDRARGKYVAFIDDDDGVAIDYVSRVLRAARTELDCASLEGVLTTRGGKPERFTHSIKNDGWFTKAGVHYRTPNHLNLIKRELALKVGFIPKNVGEDHDFSNRIRPLLKTEAFTKDKPLYFYWFDPAHSVQTR